MNPSFIQVGLLGATPVVADISELGSAAVAVYVTLNQPYTLGTNPGQPTRPQFCGTEVALGQDVAGTVMPAGSRILLLSFEAAALVAAGAAAYS